MDLSVRPLKYKSLDGISEKELSEHHGVLYAGYVKKTNDIRSALSSVKLDTANATFSDLRELKVEEVFAWNGVKLHEGYFDGMGGKGGAPSGLLADWIKQDFGSFEAWQSQFQALGLCSRGWVVLAFDLESGRLHNIIADAHNQGGVWGVVPIVIMDMYEHAFFLDYQTAKKKYIESYFKNLDWKVAEAVLGRYHLESFRK